MTNDYSVAQKVVHWLMALIIMLDLFVAQKLGGDMTELDRLQSRSDHATSGAVITILLLIRIYLRVKNGAPPLPLDMPRWQVLAARIGHFALYFLIGVLLVSGLMTAMNASSPILLFGQVDIVITGQVNETVFHSLRPIHEFATNAMIVLIAVHIVAALYHQFIVKDDTLQKMLRFWRRQV